MKNCTLLYFIISTACNAATSLLIASDSPTSWCNLYNITGSTSGKLSINNPNSLSSSGSSTSFSPQSFRDIEGKIKKAASPCTLPPQKVTAIINDALSHDETSEDEDSSLDCEIQKPSDKAISKISAVHDFIAHTQSYNDTDKLHQCQKELKACRELVVDSLKIKNQLKNSHLQVIEFEHQAEYYRKIACGLAITSFGLLNLLLIQNHQQQAGN